MSLTDFPALVDTFPVIDAGAGDDLNTAGKKHDDLHNFQSEAIVALQRVSVGPTHYNVEGRTEATFQLRWLAALAEAQAGNGGVLVLTPGAKSAASLGTITKPNVSIWVPGGSASAPITHTAGGELLRWANSPLTVTQQGYIRGLKIVGNATTGAKGITFFDTGTLPELDDVVIADFTGTSALGMLVENGTWWNERTLGCRLHLDNNTIGMKLLGVGAANSFFYWRMSDLRLNVNANQKGVQIAGTALLQGGIWNVLCNIGGNNGIVFDLADTAAWGGLVWATGEQTSGTGGVDRNYASGAIWAASGQVAITGVDTGIAANNWAPWELRQAGQVWSRYPAVPTVVANAAAGTAPPAPTITGNDRRFYVDIGTGTGTAAGNLLTVTFQTPFPFAPLPQITPFGGTVMQFRPYVAAVSPASMTIGLLDAPTVSLAAGSLGFFVTLDG